VAHLAGGLLEICKCGFDAILPSLEGSSRNIRFGVVPFNYDLITSVVGWILVTTSSILMESVFLYLLLLQDFSEYFARIALFLLLVPKIYITTKIRIFLRKRG
ncbi:hypothetical protein PanWU01x14_013120, partial [Parasponia andersonii]